MTDISEAARAKAEEMLPFGDDWRDKRDRVARFIQEVSDRCDEVWDLDSFGREQVKRHLAPFILPEPVDPLETYLAKYCGMVLYDAKTHAANLRAELADHGLKIVEDKP